MNKDKLLKKAIIELKNFRKAFESTIGCQKYEENVFACLNKRFIEAGKIIEEYTKQRLKKQVTMKTKHFYGNAMTLEHSVTIDNSLKEAYCLECGDLHEIEIENWYETETFICDSCKLEIKTNKL